QPVNTTQFDHENRSNFVLMDKGAQRSVTCSGIQQTTLADGRLQVAANVRNRESRRIEVQINCEFKDEQGFVLEATPWQTLILTENAQETVSFSSMNNEARRYTFRIRQAR
ncbi:MAG: YcfL family protein, partial [Limisphaerales bacterium]